MNFYRREGRFALCQECGALAPPVQGLGLPKAVVVFLNWLSAKDVIFLTTDCTNFADFLKDLTRSHEGSEGLRKKC
jgi:hypothetical protein